MVIIIEKINMGLASGIGLVSEAMKAFKKQETEAIAREAGVDSRTSGNDSSRRKRHSEFPLTARMML